jgi:hypothetical protein
MDRVETYRQLAKEAILSYEKFLLSPPPPSYQVDLSLDDERGQYILRRIGWSDGKRFRYTDLHLAIRNGKIWIEEDWTEDGIATWLLEHGVPKEDIVLGFQPPELRHLTEFAVA